MLVGGLFFDAFFDSIPDAIFVVLVLFVSCVRFNVKNATMETTMTTTKQHLFITLFRVQKLMIYNVYMYIKYIYIYEITKNQSFSMKR